MDESVSDKLMVEPWSIVLRKLISTSVSAIFQNKLHQIEQAKKHQFHLRKMQAIDDLDRFPKAMKVQTGREVKNLILW